jgi:CRISPR-associated protein (TIGR03984 family)
MSNPRTLHSRTTEKIELSDALNHCSAYFDNNAIGILYSPIACQFGRFHNGQIVDEAGVEISLRSVFEARIFNLKGELRWLNHSGGVGKAVLLSQGDIQNYFEQSLESIEAIDIIDSQYLLWGEGTGKSPSDENWSYLSAARIGKIAVPIQGISGQQKVGLRFREYLGIWTTEKPEDNHGNVVVLEERLLGLIENSTKQSNNAV